MQSNDFFGNAYANERSHFPNKLKDFFTRMNSRGVQPIQFFQSMMHRVEPPEERKRVTKSMNPVSKKIRNEKHHYALNEQRPMVGPQAMNEFNVVGQKMQYK